MITDLIVVNFLSKIQLFEIYSSRKLFERYGSLGYILPTLLGSSLPTSKVLQFNIRN